MVLFDFDMLLKFALKLPGLAESLEAFFYLLRSDIGHGHQIDITRISGNSIGTGSGTPAAAADNTDFKLFVLGMCVFHEREAGYGSGRHRPGSYKTAS